MMHNLTDALWLTLRAPRLGMRRILSLPRPPGMELMSVVLVALLSGLLIHLNIMLLPQEQQQMAVMLFGSPFATSGLQIALMIFGAVLMHRIGRWRGGQGGFGDCLLAMAWLQAVLFVLQLAQVLLVFAIPPLAGVVGSMAIGLFFALLTLFAAEVHGFRSVFKVFLGVILTLLLMTLALSFLLSFFIDPELLTHGL